MLDLSYRYYIKTKQKKKDTKHIILDVYKIEENYK